MCFASIICSKFVFYSNYLLQHLQHVFFLWITRLQYFIPRKIQTYIIDPILGNCSFFHCRQIEKVIIIYFNDGSHRLHMYCSPVKCRFCIKLSCLRRRMAPIHQLEWWILVMNGRESIGHFYFLNSWNSIYFGFTPWEMIFYSSVSPFSFLILSHYRQIR